MKNNLMIMAGILLIIAFFSTGFIWTKHKYEICRETGRGGLYLPPRRH